MARNRRRPTITGPDLAGLRRPRIRRPRGSFPALLVAALLAGLGLAALRIDILRLRYALADAVETERELLEEQRVWTAQAATLRDPARLAELARERGFGRPTRVIELGNVRLAASRRP